MGTAILIVILVVCIVLFFVGVRRLRTNAELTQAERAEDSRIDNILTRTEATIATAFDKGIDKFDRPTGKTADEAVKYEASEYPETPKYIKPEYRLDSTPTQRRPSPPAPKVVATQRKPYRSTDTYDYGSSAAIAAATTSASFGSYDSGSSSSSSSSSSSDSGSSSCDSGGGGSF